MILIILFALFMVFMVHQFWYRRRNLPNGPLPLPIIGNMHSLAKLDRVEFKFLEWRNQYGPIYTFWLGPLAIVSVNEYKKAIELFVKDGDTFTDRVVLEKMYIAARGGIYGINDTSGPLWQEQRRFALRVLRDFGIGKNKMQQNILEEVQTICEKINSDIDSGIDEHEFHKHTDLASGSIINALVTGHRFSADGKEDEFYRLKETADNIIKAFSDPLLIVAITYDVLTKFPIFKPKYDRLICMFDVIGGFIDKNIEEHLEQNDYSVEFEPRDFIDAFLIEMHNKEKSGEQHYFSKLQLRSVCLDLWFAGQETTSASLTWTIAFLICYPDVQEKLQKELDNVIGSDRMITVADKVNLPYTQAVIMESQRVANIVPNNLLRKTTKDIEVDGMLLKKGTIMIPQISVIMIDPDVFPSPEKFNPDRFIDSNGQFKPADEMIPFSIGKRACMGEGLARMELFLFIANLFNQYKFKPGKVAPTLKKVTKAVSMAIEPYTCKLEKRF